MMKACFKCLEVKPLSEFYKHPMMADGYLNKCKDCAKCDVKENREKRREYYMEYDRNRPNAAQRVKACCERARTAKGKIQKKKAISNYRERHPLKYAAKIMTTNAIRDGRLVRQPCEVCGGTDKIHAHHEDYTKPFDVNWLCMAHHVARHKQLNAERRAAAKEGKES
jgi:hypothetical protein